MRLYLSRLLLNPASPRAMGELLAVYELHRTVSRAFPTPMPETAGRVLYRVYEDAATCCPALLVQAAVPADWTFLRDRGDYLLPLGPGGEPNPVQKAFELAPGMGDEWQFALRANPTRKQGRRRVGLAPGAAPVEWLARQGARSGFEVLQVRARVEGTLWIRKRQGGKTWDVCLRTVSFRGVLRVTCPERFTAAVAGGLGRGRAFGLGLLSVAPGS